MTFNIRTKDADGADAQLGNEWAKRLPLARAVLADEKPAVVGLQESTAAQVSDIQEGWEVLPASDVTVLYDREQLEALEGAVVDVGNYGQMDPWGTRYCNWQRFRVVGSTAELVFFNTHLSTAGDNVPQSKFVFELAGAWAEKGYPVVVVGDFNYDAAQNLKDAGFGDAMIDKAGTFHAFAGGRSGPRLDFIGLQRTMALDSAVDTRSLAGVYPSDHYPLWATLEVAPR
jgi:endonuclease/exonuclease/phosphatase family metal-dependent hydrolase